jgi:transposase-like protein
MTVPCPKCDRRSRVAYTKPNESGILRRRICQGCQFRFTTQETVLEPDPFRNFVRYAIPAELRDEWRRLRYKMPSAQLAELLGIQEKR